MEVETSSSKELKTSKAQLNSLQVRLDEILDQIEKDIGQLKISNRKLTKLGFKINNNLSNELDQLLLNCKKWFSN